MRSVLREETTAQAVSVAAHQAALNYDLLRQMPLFEAVPKEALNALAAVTTQVTMEKNETLFRDGDPGDQVFFVCSGEVEISLTNAANTKIVLETETGGEFFGEVGALQGKTRTAAARTLLPTLALVVKGDALKTVLREHPDIMLAMYARTAQRLGRVSIDLRRTTVTDAATAFQKQLSERERTISRVARFCGSLKMLALNVAFVVVWVAVLSAMGKKPLDGVLFNALALVLTLEAIAITCIVLHSQNLQEARERFIKEKETEASINMQVMAINLDEKLNALRSELLLRLPDPNEAVVTVSTQTERGTPS